MSRIVPLLALLLGCVGKHGGDSSAGDSSDDGNDPPCELSHPWPMDSVEHVGVAGALAYPSIAELVLLDGNAGAGAQLAANQGDPCPTLTASDDGSSFTITGDCTTSSGSEYAGTATFTEVDGSFSSVYDHFHFVDGFNAYGYDIDGSWTDVDGRFTFDLDMTEIGVWRSGVPDVTVVYNTVITFYAASQGLVDGYADIVSQGSSTATGDLCVAADIDLGIDCELEDQAVMSLQGSTPATLTWDGSTACDGCADVTIDGVDAGAYCPG